MRSLPSRLFNPKLKKNNLLKTISDLELKLKESKTSFATLTVELESMKRSIKMLNSGSSKLDEILNAGRTDKIHVGVGYTGSGKIGSTQTVFVKASSSGVKIHVDLKQKASGGTPAVTPTRRSPANLNRMRNRSWIPTCHYFNRKEHIRPRCFQYFADLGIANEEKLSAQRHVDKKWERKLKPSAIWLLRLTKLLRNRLGT